MTAKRLFITGTDTGVGKTFVAVEVVTAARRLGLSVSVSKPLETGCATDGSGMLVPADAVTLMKAAGRTGDLDLICPYRFKAPLAPAVAVEAEGVEVEGGRISASLDTLSAGADLLVIEGAGGVLVPAWHGADMTDLMSLSRADVLVVARTGLGTINHTRLTVEALRNRGLPIAGLVFNRPVDPTLLPSDPSEAGNPSAVSSLTGLPVWAVFPHSPGGVPAEHAKTLKDSLSSWFNAKKRHLTDFKGDTDD
jgi:dethiobiotin synthetase